MKNEKPLIVFDADSVLLDWFRGFVAFLKGKGFCVAHLNQYIGTTQFVPTEVMTKNSCKAFNKNIMAEFAQSGVLSALNMFQKDGNVILSKLAKDYDFAVVTCIGETEDLIRQRKENLTNLYGDIFLDVLCINYGKSKENSLRKLAETRNIVAFVDDREKHLEEALLVGGIQPILMSRGVSVTSETLAKYSVISCLGEVESQIKMKLAA